MRTYRGSSSVLAGISSRSSSSHSCCASTKSIPCFSKLALLFEISNSKFIRYKNYTNRSPLSIRQGYFRSRGPHGFSNLLFSLLGGGWLNPQLRATFSPAQPTGTPRRAISPSEGLPILSTSLKGVAEAALCCAHRTCTVSPCAFCEQEGHLATHCPA